MSKAIYHYDRATGALAGTGVADLCPKGGGAIIPAFATDVAPPAAEPHQVPVFSDGAWRLVPDYRGRYFMADGEEYKITELNCTPESLGLSATIPLAAARQKAWERIKAERDRRTTQGGYTVAGKWYHSDTFSRTQQMGLVMLGQNIPAGTQWKTMDGSFVAMTPALAAQVFSAATANDIAIFAAAETHKAAMEASADPATYDFGAGWPAIYGDQP